MEVTLLKESNVTYTFYSFFFSIGILFVDRAQMLIEIDAYLQSSLLVVQLEWKTRAEVPLAFNVNDD